MPQKNRQNSCEVEYFHLEPQLFACMTNEQTLIGSDTYTLMGSFGGFSEGEIRYVSTAFYSR